MATKAKPKISAERIIDAYVKQILSEGKSPASVFSFADSLGIQEAEFYKYFSSFESIEAAVWNDLIERTLGAIKADSNYADFSAREKLLAFFYTHLEILCERRSFVCMKWTEIKKHPRTPKVLEGYKKSFITFAKEIVTEGTEKDEIKYRPMLSERYDQAFWLQLVFIVDYWCKDNSQGFEQSDAAIEKAVNFSFQLLGETALDGAIDFAKFLWQSK